jgi:TonB family protein
MNVLQRHILHPWARRTPVALAVLISTVVHLGLSSVALFIATRPLDQKTLTRIHPIELVTEPEVRPASPPRHAAVLRREVGRLGDHGSRLSAQTHASSRTPGTASGLEQPAPRKDEVTGEDTRNLSSRVFTHRTLNLKKHRHRGRATALPTRRPTDEEPTPFLTPGSARPRADARLQRAPNASGPEADQERRDAPSQKGEQLSRIPLEGTAPDRSPSRQPTPAQTSRQRLLDLMEGARPDGRGTRSGHGRGSQAGRRGSSSGGDRDRFIYLSTHDRRYLDYFRSIYRKVNPLWLFPKKLEVLLEQGDVLIQFTILADGEVKDVRVRKSSGFKEFDRNVVAAIHQAAPFGPIPKGLGRRLRILAPFEFANPMVR